MNEQMFLYLGSGLLVGSAILGLAAALAYILRSPPKEFKYGAFYSIFALVAFTGYWLTTIPFYFRFLGQHGNELPTFCSLISLAFAAGLIVLAIFVRKDSRVLFVVLSFYPLLVFYLAPVFIWNMIYVACAGRRPWGTTENSPLPPKAPAA